MVPLYSVAAVQADVWPVFPSRSGTPVPEHRERNLARVEELIRRCADWNPARLYLLPEFFLTGSGGVGPPRNRELMCIRIPGPETARLGALAREVNAWIAGMAWEIIDDWPDRYWNTAFIISPEGEVVLRYHKHYDLTGKTRPGDLLDEYIARYGQDALFPVVDTPLGRLACLTCYDINFPEVARCLALRGAEVLLHPTAEGRSPYLHPDTGGWDACRRARAYENLCYLVTANMGRFRDSDFPEHRLRGRSQVIDFEGRVLNIADTPGEAIIQADLEIERLRQRRDRIQMNFLAQLQPEVHAPFYAAARLWPTHLFRDQGPTSDRANTDAGQQQVERLQQEGLFVAPAHPLRKPGLR